MKSLKQMLDQCEGLLGTADVTNKEREFIADMVEECRDHFGSTSFMTGPQANWLTGIWRKHFA